MREPEWETVTEKELWEYIGFHLAQAGIDSVLVGGSVVSIYTEGAYVSGDLDFVQLDLKPWQLIEKIMLQLGFVKKTKHFTHPKCKHLAVEFGSFPLAIGEDFAIKPITKKYKTKTLKILSPTDCIKDRLASYIYFQDRDCLDQAVLVAKRQKFKLASVKKWCFNEGGPAMDAFNEFKKLTQ